MMYHTRAYPEYLKPCLSLFYSSASENIVFFWSRLETFPESVKTFFFFFKRTNYCKIQLEKSPFASLLCHNPTSGHLLRQHATTHLNSFLSYRWLRPIISTFQAGTRGWGLVAAQRQELWPCSVRGHTQWEAAAHSWCPAWAHKRFCTMHIVQEKLSVLKGEFKLRDLYWMILLF